MVLVKPLVWEFLLQESQRARAFESVFSRRLGDLAVLARRPLSHDSATDPMQDGQPLLLAHAVVCTQDVADRILCFYLDSHGDSASLLFCSQSHCGCSFHFLEFLWGIRRIRARGCIYKRISQVRQLTCCRPKRVLGLAIVGNRVSIRLWV